MQFEWDENKELINIPKHGIDFSNRKGGLLQCKKELISPKSPPRRRWKC